MINLSLFAFHGYGTTPFGRRETGGFTRHAQRFYSDTQQIAGAPDGSGSSKGNSQPRANSSGLFLPGAFLMPMSAQLLAALMFIDFGFASFL
jgi:hypothetical protein